MLQGSSSSTSYTFSGLACGTSYTLAADAYDAAGNHSPAASLFATTSPCADTTPPSTPGSLATSGVTQTSITLSWAASTDNTAVAGYGAYKNAALQGSTGSTSYTFSGLTCGTTYTLAADAYDAAGNRSTDRVGQRENIRLQRRHGGSDRADERALHRNDAELDLARVERVD